MASEIVFYTHPTSRGRIVRWMLEEIGVDYTTEIVEYGQPMKSSDYLAINPMGKVPALRHGDAVVTEAAAICAHLGDAFPEAGLAPAAGARGAYYRWLFFGAGPLEASTTNRHFGFTVPDDGVGMIGYGTWEHVMDVLDEALAGGGYIAGEDFSAADIYIGCQVGWGMHYGTVDKRPAFEDYWARLSAREACRRATAMDDELMADAKSPF